MDRVAVAVAEHLEFDVARIAEVLLDIDRRVTESRLRLAAGLLDQRLELVRAVAHLHAAPAAARSGLDDHRIASRFGNRLGLGNVGDRAIRSGHQRQAECARGALGLDLVAHGADMLGLGADPDDVMRFDDIGELGVLREEAVAGVDRIALGDFGRRDDVGDVEIRVGGRRRADAHRMVGEAHMHRVGIGGGVHRDRLDPHFMRRAVDAQGDLAAIGDQDAFDTHGFRRSPRGAGRIRPAGLFRSGSR